LKDGSSKYGVEASLETTVVKEWLKVELGVSPVFGDDETKWNTELLFKKPFALSENVEVMPGIGPTWIHKIGADGSLYDSVAGTAVVDLVFWPLPERKIGLHVKPNYSYDFGGNHDQSFGVTVGFLIAFP
jgi:hypothetical protein